ncbi:MAG: phosphodiester glycosidase family protein [Bacteroidaceae bacterium]
MKKNQDKPSLVAVAKIIRQWCFSVAVVLFFSVSTAGATELLIQGTTFQVDTLAAMKVGPGTYYTAVKYSTNSRQLRVFFVSVDVTNPYMSFQTVLAKDSIVTGEITSQMAIRKSTEGKQYIAGTNGDFFMTTTPVGRPIHGFVADSEIGLVPTNTPHVGFAGKIPFIDQPSFAGSEAKIGTATYPISGVNSTRNTDQLIVFNTMNGYYTKTSPYGTEVVLQLVDGASWATNKPLSFKVIERMDNKGNTHIQKGQIVLSGHGKAADFLKSLQKDNIVELTLNCTLNDALSSSNITALLGGDRMILQDGVVLDNDWADWHPRTCVGYSSDRSTFYFCLVDGRGISSGVSTKQLADIIKSAGASTALNLDGGGSSAMYIKKLGVVNTPSDGQERAVANGLFAVNTAPTDAVLAAIAPTNTTIKLPLYGEYTPVFYGYNKYETLIDTKVKGVKLSCPASVGYIVNDTTFVATGASGTLTATVDGLSTTINVINSGNVQPALRLTEVIVDAAHPYLIEVQSLVNDKWIPLNAASFTWKIADPTLCKVEEGKLIGLKSGTTKVTGTLGEFSVELTAIVQLPASQTLSVDHMEDLSTWTLNSNSPIVNPTLSADVFPASLSFTFKGGRAPYLQLYKLMPMYSIPKAIRLTFNPGDLALSKLVMSFKGHNAAADVSYTMDEFTPNQDNVLEVKMSDILSDVEDRDAYPVMMQGCKFYLSAADNTAGSTYAIAIKEYAFLYDDSVVGIENTDFGSTFVVAPNPVQNKNLTILFDKPLDTPVVAALYGLSGTKIFTHTASALDKNEVSFSVASVPAGWYLLQVGNASFSRTVKVMIQ